jgi:uroporphyrinogen-III synthase
VSLNGKRVVVTRAPHQAGSLVKLLRERGAIPVLYPCIDISPSDDPALDEAVERISDFDWIVFTSPNTAYALSRYGVSFDGPSIAAVGGKTACIVRHHVQREITFVPQRQLGAALGETLPLHSGAKVFLPQSGRADNSLAETLRARGANVTIATAYKNDLGRGGDDLSAMLTAGKIDAITFTSGSTVENLSLRLGDAPTDVPAACIGPSTGAVAGAGGYKTVLVPEADYSLEGMVGVLEGHFDV